MEFKNRGYVKKVVSLYDSNKDRRVIQNAYLVALNNNDSKMFSSLYNKSNVKPKGRVLGLIKKISEGDEKFSRILEYFE